MKKHWHEIGAFLAFAALSAVGWSLWSGQGQLIWLAGYGLICG